MSLNGEDDRGEVQEEADDIASKMIGILVGKFKEREGRDPTAEEAEQLLSELTEERVEELLGMGLERGGEVDEHEAKGVVISSAEKAASATTTTGTISSTKNTSISEELDQAPSQEADDIASGIWKILTNKFKEKTGQDPNEDDIAKMLEEMTEERVTELLSVAGASTTGTEDGSPKRKPAVEGIEGEDQHINSNNKRQKTAQ